MLSVVFVVWTMRKVISLPPPELPSTLSDVDCGHILTLMESIYRLKSTVIPSKLSVLRLSSSYLAPKALVCWFEKTSSFWTSFLSAVILIFQKLRPASKPIITRPVIINPNIKTSSTSSTDRGARHMTPFHFPQASIT